MNFNYLIQQLRNVYTKNANDFGYDDSQTKPKVNDDEIYKNFKWSIRGVEQ